MEIQKIEEGLAKIAFGSCRDAVKLLLRSDTLTDRQLNRLDLFNVAAVKRSGNCISEIKLFDRIKAMDCLLRLSSAESGGADGFIEALVRSAGVFPGEEMPDRGEETCEVLKKADGGIILTESRWDEEDDEE